MADPIVSTPPGAGSPPKRTRYTLFSRRRLVIGGLCLILLGWLFYGIELQTPRPTWVLMDRHGDFLGEVGGDPQAGNGFWPLDELPPRVAAATLAAEDRRFWSHPGVDILAVGRALWQNLSRGDRVSGASTLAMQVARLQRPAARTYLNKAQEAVVAVILTLKYGREAVLGQYLRLAPYGHQVRGIAAAARRYFDKPAADLSWAEAALLTAIPQAPGRMSPLRAAGRERANRRGTWILGRLLEQGVISQEEQALALAELRELKIRPRPERPPETMHALFRLGAQLAGEARPGGSILTSLDLPRQRLAQGLARETLDHWEAKGAGNAALMLVDLQDLGVLAAVGSADYFDRRRAGALDYTRVPRSPGSTLKPFVYALALERGQITPATILDDLPGGMGWVQNADGRYLGPLLVPVALANSRNVPAVELLHRVGLQSAYDLLADLGLHRADKPARHYGLGLAVGGMPVTLEALIQAYTSLARDGRLGRLRWYRDQSEPPARRLFSEDTTRQIALMLSDPQVRLPTFPRMGHLEYPFPVAVKTGTSSYWHDAWALAWSGRYLVAAWVGRPDGQAMEGVSGYASAALAQGLLQALHPREMDGQEDVGFPPPRGSQPVRLCALTGQVATPACERVLVQYLRPQDIPLESCAAHRRLAVDGRNGLLAGSHTPADQVEIRSFVDLGPRYADWQAAQGLPLPPETLSPLDLGGRVAAWTPTSNGQLRYDPTVVTKLKITSPRQGQLLIRDPEAPPDTGIPLTAIVEPAVEQLVWYVDGKPFRVADRPYRVNWPLQPGVHLIQARLPYAQIGSEVVKVTVY